MIYWAGRRGGMRSETQQLSYAPLADATRICYLRGVAREPTVNQ